MTKSWWIVALVLALSASPACEGGGSGVDDDDATGDDDDDATDDDDTAGDDDSTPFDPPEWCEDAIAGEVQPITTTAAAPYYVIHPDTAALDVPTVIFLPGGQGSRGGADSVWNNWLSQGDGVEQMRVAILWTEDSSLLDEYDRTVGVREELLLCYGGDPARVHLGGTSNGGMGAFDLILDSPDGFATLLGAPGVFSTYPAHDDELITAALGDKAVFNGVGEIDDSWNTAVRQTNDMLDGLGVESVFVEFEGQGHILTPEFDETVFFDFWLAY